MASRSLSVGPMSSGHSSRRFEPRRAATISDLLSDLFIMVRFTSFDSPPAASLHPSTHLSPNPPTPYYPDIIPPNSMSASTPAETGGLISPTPASQDEGAPDDIVICLHFTSLPESSTHPSCTDDTSKTPIQLNTALSPQEKYCPCAMVRSHPKHIITTMHIIASWRLPTPVQQRTSCLQQHVPHSQFSQWEAAATCTLPPPVSFTDILARQQKLLYAATLQTFAILSPRPLHIS